MVEKPLATSIIDGKAMVAAAAKAGVKLMVDFHARWHPLFMGAKAYIDRGDLGAPVMGYARLSDTIYVPTEMLGWSSRSGPEWFLFPHIMDVVRWLIGREPVEVYAKGHRGVLAAKGVDCWDAIQALVEFEGGASVTFETSWIVPNSYTNVVDNRLTLYGEKGGLELRNEPNLWVFTDRFHTPFSSESVTRYGKAWGFQYEFDPLFHRLCSGRCYARIDRRRWSRCDSDDRGNHRFDLAAGASQNPRASRRSSIGRSRNRRERRWRSEFV